MPLDTQTLCGYRLERAKEDLLTAEYNFHAVYRAHYGLPAYTVFFLAGIFPGFFIAADSNMPAFTPSLVRVCGSHHR